MLAPLRTVSGQTVVRVAGRPISVWPFVEGTHLEAGNIAEPAALLARCHRCLADVQLGPRPEGAGTVATRSIADIDPVLDAWINDFDSAHHVQPLHGDFYAGNLLTRDGSIVAVLDWDEALVSSPTRELAWAAWEFGNGLWATDLSTVWQFVAAYRDAGGPARPPTVDELESFVRQRLIGELRYIDEHTEVTELDDNERAHRQQKRYVLQGLSSRR